MRKLLVILVAASTWLISVVSCSKEKITQKEQGEALSIMTDGAWIITTFKENDKDITSIFSGYECRFDANKTCVATKGSQTVSGTWDVSVTSKTITSWFPDDSEPLPKINGVWHLVKSNSSFGEFSQTKNGIVLNMELTKK